MLTGNTITLPTEWALSPAFPNPFNPVTTINFNIPKIVESQGMMSLQVYNINGKLIETLIDGRLESGFHTIDWNAKNSPSGVYFVTLVSETFTQTQKIMLLK
jgi:flagellar hook assembly protein FlgD